MEQAVVFGLAARGIDATTARAAGLSGGLLGVNTMQVADKAYEELVDFFARGTSCDDILNFHPSPATQERASYLLERNRRGELSSREAEELERFGQFEHLVQLVKARARLYAESTS